jgi:hypothetical protein
VDLRRAGRTCASDFLEQYPPHPVADRAPPPRQRLPALQPAARPACPRRGAVAPQPARQRLPVPRLVQPPSWAPRWTPCACRSATANGMTPASTRHLRGVDAVLSPHPRGSPRAGGDEPHRATFLPGEPTLFVALPTSRTTRATHCARCAPASAAAPPHRAAKERFRVAHGGKGVEGYGCPRPRRSRTPTRTNSGTHVGCIRLPGRAWTARSRRSRPGREVWRRGRRLWCAGRR